MGKREAALLFAGVIILGLVVWRTRQLEEWQNDPQRVPTSLVGLAPRFTLADQNRKIVKLERLLGRHRVVLAFFDAELGVDQDPRTKPLIDLFSVINDAGIKVIAVSTVTPFANEQAETRLGREIPFPVLTDIDINDPAPAPAHRMYGLYDAQTNTTQPGLFLIDRDGSLPIGGDGLPQSIANVDAVIEQLKTGQWP